MPWPRITAHRGAGRLAPENTLAAFRHGQALGQRAFECDVRLSADGVPFLLHDDTLARTTNGQGAAVDWTWSALSRLDAGGWHSPAFAGEPPASLAAIVRHCQATGSRLNVELKPSPGQAQRTGRVVADALAHAWAGRDDLPLLSTFDPEALAAARAQAPHLPRALLSATLAADLPTQAHALGCCAVVLHHRVLNPTVLRDLRQQGLHVLAYTVNQPERARQLLADGLHSAITDEVAQLLP